MTTKPVSNDTLLNQLNWRYATKQFDPSRKIPAADASHLVVFAVKTQLGAADVDHYLDRIAQVRGVARESLGGFRGVLLDFLAQPADQFNPQHWAARQAYIALGNLLTSTALLGIDACPLEGIEPRKYDEILGLSAHGYQTVVAAAVGYRAAGDKYATLPKVRFAPAEVITHVA